MSTQYLLFNDDERAAYDVAKEAKKLARRNDPSTSKAAARRAAGNLRANQAIVLRAVVAHGGSTYAEIAAYAGVDDAEPGRRLPELKEMKFVEVVGQRKCRVKKTQCRTWMATAAGLDWARRNPQ